MSAASLTIKIQDQPNSRIAVEVEVPETRCKASYNEALSRLSRSIKLPGFRKGKVPTAVLIQQIGILRIRASALEKLAESIWREAIEQESLEPLCEPVVQGGFDALLDRFDPTQPLTLILETDVAPSPKLIKTKGLEAEVQLIAFNPEKVDELIEQSRKQLATLIPVENRSLESGDVAVVSFNGFYSDDASPVEGGSSESMDIDIEPGKMIPGFIEGMIGMSLNEERTVECQFPEDYSDEKSRGRKANFLIKLKELKTRELPDLDDAFAKQAGDKSNMDELRKDIEDRLKDDLQSRYEGNRKQVLAKALVEQLEIDLPETLIQQEIRNLIEQMASNFAQQGMDVKSIFTSDLVKSLMDSSRPEAVENLKKNFALKALAEQEGIDISSNEIQERLKEVRSQFERKDNIDERKLKELVREDLLSEKLFQWLEENSSITEKSEENDLKDEKVSSKTKKIKEKTVNSSEKTSNSEKSSAKKPKS